MSVPGDGWFVGLGSLLCAESLEGVGWVHVARLSF